MRLECWVHHIACFLSDYEAMVVFEEDLSLDDPILMPLELLRPWYGLDDEILLMLVWDRSGFNRCRPNQEMMETRASLMSD